MVQAGRPHYTPQCAMGVAHIAHNPMKEEQGVMNMHGYYSGGVLSNRCGYLLHKVVVFRDYLLYADLMAMHRAVPGHWVYR